MGVPAFYRWLSEKYPKVVEDVLEARVHLANDSGSIRLPFDSTLPNPSGLECDNLYIDMNGIIHPCSHPEVGPQPQSTAEMYENVCHYVDRLFRATRPRKLLYLAIDGVAPRAKMNQQRSRRFRTAQEMRENDEMEAKIIENMKEQGHKYVQSKPKQWDSNVITPGTKFMLDLSEYIRFYIRKRISTDPAWKQITILFSDASIPGEGEHKIMAHIRHQRNQPKYNPNLVHVLHGLDADLIMLALATHEAHFYILREEVLFGRRSAETAQHRRNVSGFTDAQKQLDEMAGTMAMELPENKQKPLQRISIPTLREYLANEFRECARVPFQEISFERLIDDIVFLCFFVGNDFLPHLPSLDIRDGALDFLFNVYKRILPSLGDYITNHGGEVNLSHVDVILSEVGAIEDYVFQMKHNNEQAEKRRREESQARKKYLTKDGKAPLANDRQAPPSITPSVRGKAARILEKGNSTMSNNNVISLGRKNSKNISAESNQGNHNAAKEIKESISRGKIIQNDDSASKSNVTNKAKIDDEPSILRSEKKTNSSKTTDSSFKVHIGSSNDEIEVSEAEVKGTASILKTRIEEEQRKKLNNYANNVDDKVRLHEKGWKDRYYKDKCKAEDVAHHGGREHLFRSYVVGLCWVMKYYYQGCPSWKWYFPFHYAPFASDLRNIERFSQDCKNFELCEPFNPVEQLMAVLPPESSHAIPKSSRWLMTDAESPIIDFYPKEIHCDPNGKAMPWLWVVLLPFIDENRLLNAIDQSEWTEYEKLSNCRGLDDGYVYCHITHPLASALAPALDLEDSNKRLTIHDCVIAGDVRKPLRNEIYPLDEVSTIKPPKSSIEMKNESGDELFSSPINPNAALCAAFTQPKKGTHKSILLFGVNLAPPILSGEDLVIRRPRLNFRGSTIANMGGSAKNQSNEHGYGSMNISSHDRDLARRQGRGHEMYQTGTRAWGAMEPISKRQRITKPSQQEPQQYSQTLFQPLNSGYRKQQMQNSHDHGYHQQRSHQNRWQPPPTNSHHIAQQHQFSQIQGHFQSQQRRQHSGPVREPRRAHREQSQVKTKSGVNESMLKSLRAQLKGTLNNNRAGGSGK